MITKDFHIAVPTAFYDDEEINVIGTINYIKYLYEKGVDSVLVCGTTGEQHSLKLEEKIELITAINNDEMINNIEVIFGVSSTWQKEAEILAETINSTKISGIMLGYPPYIKPSQKEAINYTKTIIEKVNKPTILYNNPGRTGFDLSIESIVQLSNIKNVVGVKDAGDKEKVNILKQDIKNQQFYYYAGGEINLEEKIKYGYDRLSSIAGNIYPEEVQNWFFSLLGGNRGSNQDMVNLKRKINKLYNENIIVNIKQINNEKGVPLGVSRSPLGKVRH